MTIDSISQNLEDYYKDKLDRFGESAQQVGWKDKNAQLMRFEQLLKIIDTSNPFSVNDVGCGLGDFAEFLNERTPGLFHYIGYDVFEIMTQKSKERYSTTPNLQFKCISSASDIQEADYTVASGIFNIRMKLSDEEWLQYILDTLHHINTKSKKSFSFNALTKYSDAEFMKEELYYSDPLFLFDYCQKNFSKNVALLHDYNQYDFTILVRKEI